MTEFQLTYILGKSTIGMSRLNIPAINKPHSLAFFCSTCGKIWASILVQGSESCWEVYNRPCERHTPMMACEDHTHPPGSMVAYIPEASRVGSGSWAGTYDAMPFEVRKREARLRGIDLEHGTLIEPIISDVVKPMEEANGNQE